MRSLLSCQTASIINFLDRHDGALTAILSALLIVVTVYYAVQNRRMVKEMVASRQLQITPQLVLGFHRLGPTVMTTAIRNIGLGAALYVDVRVTYHPMASGSKPLVKPWMSYLLGSGEQADVLPPGDLADNLNSLPRDYERISLTGTMRDVAGVEHEVSATLDDLASWRKRLEQAQQRFVEAEPERRLAHELESRFKGHLDKLIDAIDRIPRRPDA